VSSAEERARRDADWRSRHGEQVAAALDRGDPAEIKRLYVELGGLLEDSYADDVEGVPQLSVPETVPVVTGVLGRVRGRILDAGCGPHPVASIALANDDPARTVVALDLGFGTVRLARARAAQAGIGVLGVVGDLENLPFRAEAFDGLVCDDTIEHVPDDQRGVRELMRVTRRGGTAALVTPNRRSLAVLVQKARDRVRGNRQPASAYYVAESHLREYTWAELVRLVQPAARIVDRSTVGWSGGRKSRLATSLTRHSVLRDFDRMLVAVLTPR
jgi:2-polyprenyl-3-methyl-5-hydroxy-6-metoxy-1,4-benzoquinol methylase